jgi:hypothetical protein
MIITNSTLQQKGSVDVGGRTLLHFFVLSYNLGADLMYCGLWLCHLLCMEEHFIGFLIVESNLNWVPLRSGLILSGFKACIKSKMTTSLKGIG